MIALLLLLLSVTASADGYEMLCDSTGANCIDISETWGRAIWYPGSPQMQYCIATPQAWALFDAKKAKIHEITHVCWELRSIRDSQI